MVRVQPELGYGLIAQNKIPTGMGIQIHETVKNTTIIEAKFPHAEISTHDGDLMSENKIVKLQYSKVQDHNDTSLYIIQPIPTLSYLYGGQFDVILNITNAKTRLLQKEYGTSENTVLFTLPSVISIQSVDSYQNVWYSQKNYGLTLMVLGVSIVISGSVAGFMVDYFVQSLPIKKPRYPENKNIIKFEKPYSGGAPMDVSRDRFDR